MIVFILAAGKGTRLRPLTEHCPKALVPWQGKPLLACLLERLQAYGYRHFVLNLHHFAGMLRDYAETYARGHGVRIDFSDESPGLLDTGGALVHALPLLRGEERVLVHNVDIFSDLDLPSFVREAEDQDADALLSVRRRETSRLLYADGQNRLRAWKNLKTGQEKGDFRQTDLQAYAFSGIHVLKTSLIEDWKRAYGENQPFSVIDAYMGSCHDSRILLQEQSQGYWKDMGKIEDFALRPKGCRDGLSFS